MRTRVSSCGCGNRRTQVKQVSNDDLKECFYNPILNHKTAECAQCFKCVSENCNAENVRLEVCACAHRYSQRFKAQQPGRPVLGFLQFVQGRVLRYQMRYVMVTVDMIAMAKNPDEKTLLKVIMSMTTTMTTVLHRGFWTFTYQLFPFPLYNLFVFSVFFSLYGTAASSWLGYTTLSWPLQSRLLSEVAVFLLCNLLLCQTPPHRTAWCACDVARPRDSGPPSLREEAASRNSSNLLHFWVLWFCRVSMTSTSCEYSSMLNVNAKDVHDESTADSLLCLLLDLLGDALQYASNKYKMSHLVFDIWSIFGLEHDLRPLELHVVPSCSVVQHEFWIFTWNKKVIDSCCIFPCVILDQFGNHRRFVWRLQDLFYQVENEEYFCFFLVQSVRFFR